MKEKCNYGQIENYYDRGYDKSVDVDISAYSGDPRYNQKYCKRGTDEGLCCKMGR